MNKNMHIVVSGRAYADIDVLACVSSYTELLNLKLKKACGIITAPWNQTIPESIRNWPINISSVFLDSPDSCSFILVDLSDPEYMEYFVSLDNVVEVYDHHYGREAYWNEKILCNAHIEKVGACATLIWEKFKEAGLESSISSTGANLLYTAIFANTLNFKSDVTTERDRLASKELLKYTTLPEDWINSYYSEVAKGFDDNLSDHIKNDTKIIDLDGAPCFFGQVEVLNATSILAKLANEFEPKPNEEWLINVASIDENCSYLYSNSDRLHERLTNMMELKSHSDNVKQAPRLWLRKELLREFSIAFRKT